jgi:hypothetical protein
MNLLLGVLVAVVGMSGPPLTTQDRIAAAETVCSDVLSAMKQTDSLNGHGVSKVRLKTKIVRAFEKDAPQKRDIELDALLDTRSQLTAMFRCRVESDTMQIKLACFSVPYSTQEADPRRQKSLDVIQDVLTSWLESHELPDDHKTHVLKQWSDHRDKLFQIGSTHEFEHQGITYTFWTNGEGKTLRVCLSIR